MNGPVMQESGWRRWLRHRLPEFRFKPHTGRLWLDLVYLLVLVAFEVSILKSLTGPFLVIDLVTPWLVTSIIQKRAGSATLVMFVAAMIQEAQSSLPSGTLICAYWIITNVIVQVRPALSWRSMTPWLVIFASSSLFVTIFQLMINVMISGLGDINFLRIIQLFIQVLISVIFGLTLCRQWMTIDAEEPVPQ